MSRRCYLKEARQHIITVGGVLDSDQSSSPVVTLNERVETAANIRDWPKEESEWRDDATLVRLSSVCRLT